jgi:hypothetical protein
MALWTPALVSTALWLDADDSGTITLDGSAVTEWRDKSGNSRHVAQGTPANRPSYSSTGFNSKGALTFDGSNDFLSAASGITSGTYTGRFEVFYVATREGNGGVIITERSTANVGVSQWVNISSVYYISSDGATAPSNTTISSTVYNNLASGGGVVYHGHQPGVRDVLWLNGAAQTVTAGTASNITGSAGFLVGSREGAPGSTWDGKMCEVLVLLSAPSTETRQKVEGYLAHKWGLTGSLPSDHPYKTDAPQSFTVSGVVTGADGDPVARIVRAYSRSTGELLAETTSDASTGYYGLAFESADEVQRVVLDNATTDPLYNDLIDRVIPQ